MKKILALFLVLALVLGLSVSAMADPVTITYAHFSGAGAQEETLKKMIEVLRPRIPTSRSTCRSLVLMITSPSWRQRSAAAMRRMCSK